MARPKKEELHNHDEVLNTNEQFAVFMKQSNANEVRTGATCADIRVLEGNPIIDKETKLPKVNPDTGEVMKWNDRYFAVLTADGLEFETEITKEQYENVLTVGSRFLCIGRLSKIKHYGQEILAPVYYAFTKLY